MVADRGREIEALFMACRQLPAGEWEAHLAAAGADIAVSAEVLSLLRADTGLVDFLETQASAPLEATPQSVPDAGHAANPGEERIGPYLLREEIGQGGMGKVVLGVRTDGELEMKAAIKFSHPNASSQITARFLRERQLLADLKHPHIAAILDAGTSPDGRAYLIMDYITGSHIDQWCAATQPPLPKLLALFRKVVDAVAFAHQRGVIHRDLKPANLMVTHQGTPVLLDFGIAHLVAEENLLTGVHQRLHTPAYAAPEQITGAPATPAMDIYALGIILLDLLVGGGPQERHGAPADMISRLILDGRLLRPVSDAPEGAVLDDKDRIETIPEALGHVLRTCLEQDPRHRYQTAVELGVDLDRVLLNLARDQRLQTTSPKTFDALLWFANADLEPVTILAKSLRQAGLKIWFAPWSTAGGQDPDRALIQNLPATRTCLICVGPGASPPWMEDAAVRDALAFQSGETRLIPVLLPGAPYPIRQSDLPVFLQDLYWEPLVDGLEDPGALIQRLRAVDQNRSSVHTGVCPFRGLSVFREEDRAWFFGRDALIQRLARQMEEQRFCAVLGPSGSGKSSVVQAGLIPCLRQTDGEPLLFTPTQNPFLELAHQLQRLLPRAWRGEDLFTRLTGSEQALHFIAREWCAASGHSRLYLVIDQFEEVFTLAAAHARAFLDCLCFALGQKGGPVAVVITMRSDFMGKCVVYPALNKQVMDHLIQVEPMSRENLALAIQEPAGLSGLRLEPGLLERILDEVTGAPAALPLLEHMLLELYERRQNDLLTQVAYNSIGGVEGALAGRAEAEYQALEPTQRDTLRKMFTLCLIHPGEGAEDTRRRAARDELLAVGEAPEAVLNQWIDARLLTTSRDAVGDVDMVDVAHEALIRNWPRLSAWMDEDREKARRLARLREAARTWEAAGYHSDHLLRGAPLAQMQVLQEEEGDNLEPLVRRFIAMGLRGERRRRQMGLALSGLGFLLAAVSLVMFFQADKAKKTAVDAFALAEGERIKAVDQTRRANYNLALSYERAAAESLEQGRPDKAWAYALTALSKEIPPQADLPRVRGLFADPRMKDVDRLVWRTPMAPAGTCMALDASGRLLAVADDQRSILVYDLSSGACVARLGGQQKKVTHLAFSWDSQHLVSASKDGEVRLWTVQDSGVEYASSQVIAKENQAVVDLACSPHGPQFALALQDGVIVGKISPNGAETSAMQRWRPTEAGVSNVAFASEDNRLWIGGSNGRVWVLDAALQGVSQWDAHQGEVTVLLPLEDGRMLTGSADHTLAVWQDGRNLFHLKGHHDAVTKAAVMGQRLISASAGGEVSAWDLQSGGRIDHPFGQTPTEARGLIGHPLGLAVLSKNGTFSLLDRDQGDALMAFEGYREGVTAVAVSPDGRHVASADGAGDIHIRETANGRLLTKLLGHTGRVFDLEWSHDGKLLASGCLDQTARLWDPMEGVELNSISGRDGYVGYTTFSPDDRYLLTISSMAITLWDVVARTVVTKKMLNVGESEGVFSRDGRLLYYSDMDQIHVMDVARQVTIKTLTGHTSLIRRLSLSSDGKRLASAANDHTVRLWDLTGQREPMVLRGHRDMVWHVAFSPDDKVLATTSLDSTVRLWDADTGEVLALMTHHNHWVEASQWTPNGDRLLTHSYDGTVRLWDRGGKLLANLTQGGRVFDMDLTTDGRFLAVAGGEGTLSLWDIHALQNVNSLQGSYGRVYKVLYLADDQSVAAISGDQMVRVWNAESGALIRAVKNDVDRIEDDIHDMTRQYGFFFHDTGVYEFLDLISGRPVWRHEGQGNYFAWSVSEDGSGFAMIDKMGGIQMWRKDWDGLRSFPIDFMLEPKDVILSSDADLLGIMHDDHYLHIFDTNTQNMISKIYLGENQVESAFIYSAQNLLLAYDNEYNMSWWDLDQGTKIKSVAYGSNYVPRTFAIHGDYLLFNTPDNQIQMWDVKNHQRLLSFQGHSNEIMALTFSPDGHMFASGGDDRMVKVWDRITGKEIGVLAGHKDYLGDLSFSLDSSHLASGAYDNLVLLWDLDRLKKIYQIKEQPLKMQLTQKAYQHFGFRLNGLELKSEPKSWLSAMGGYRFPKENPATDHHPRDRALLDWLSTAR